MKQLRKIKAFTLSELLVVLIISTIVIGLTMSVLNLVQQQVQSITKNENLLSEVRLLEKALQLDFQRCDLRYDKRKNQLIAMSVSDTIYYQFSTTQVVRNADSLRVPVAKLTCYLDGVEVTNQAIDALEIAWTGHGTTNKLFIAKTKDAAFYMNRNGLWFI